jgi:hypothetical protein
MSKYDIAVLQGLSIVSLKEGGKGWNPSEKNRFLFLIDSF